MYEGTWVSFRAYLSEKKKKKKKTIVYMAGDRQPTRKLRKTLQGRNGRWDF